MVPYYEQRNYVLCPECKEEHFSDEVEFLDCYEGDRGQDVMKFVCPVTKKETESNVYRGR